MFFIDRITSRPLAIFITVLIIGAITSLDYVTGEELSFSIFYILPLAYLAMNKTSTRPVVIILSLIAALCWFLVEINSREYSMVIFPIWNAFVRFSIFIAISLLVFSFREKHQHLKGINQKLEHLNIEKNKFIGVAAHDIRNPVSSIYSFSDLLLDDKMSNMSDDELEIIQLMKSLSQNILDLIKNLLDVSKIESGMLELNYERQDYISYMKKQIRINQLLANQKEITIHLQNQEHELMSDFDSHHMTEVINNLLSNAIKFSEKKSVIYVSVSQKENRVFTEIVDHGKGIPLEEQEKLFNYFQKTSTKPTDGETSTGLGLAIVKKIVTGFNGSIGVKSTLNQGSSFYFNFPVNKF